MKRIGIIDTGAGNIRSLSSALQRSLRAIDGAQATGISLLTTPADCDDSISHLVVPGQGRFGSVMRHLRAKGWELFLRDWIKNDRPLLGICVGLQILFDSSDEDPLTPGLAFFAGTVHRLQSPKQPMMGWADVHFDQHSEAFYFVNSYAVKAAENTTGFCVYGEEFSAAIGSGKLMACQFHPEKSGRAGQDYLTQWLRLS